MNQKEIRDNFPFFNTNPDISYLDSAATSQKPKIVLDALSDFYTRFNANANRGAYQIAVESTALLESARSNVARFIGASSPSEIIFTKSATESINLVAYSYGLNKLQEGDEVLISIAEHHSNLVNWQYICQKAGAKLSYFYLDDDLNIDLNDFKSKLNENTKIVSFTGASNVLSFDVPAKEMTKLAHQVGAKVLIDGTQQIVHSKVDVSDLDCDFYAFSGHKLYAEFGVGVLYGKKELLDNMDPFLLGGDMIEYVMEDHSSYAELPHKFEAGTSNVGAIHSLDKAIQFIDLIGYDAISQIEEDLVAYGLQELSKLDFIKLYYPKNGKGTNITFTVDGVHPHDVSQILDSVGVDIRVGHHCAQPLHRYLGINSSCRASLAIYNTKAEIDRLVEGLKKVKEIFYGS